MKVKNVVLGAIFSGLLIASNGVAGDVSASINVDSVGILENDHLVVTLQGTYSCGPLPQPQPTSGSTYASAEGTLRQVSGKSISDSYFHFQPLCDGELQSFEAIASAGTMPLHGGKARVRAYLDVQRCDEYWNCESAYATDEKQIKIRGGGK